jgi:hypothetical protein
MATWATLTTLAAKQLLTYTHMNNIKNDIDILRTPARYFYQRPVVDGDYTEASTTFNDIDATNIDETLTTTGNPVQIRFYSGRHNNTATALEIDLIIDGVSVMAGTPIWRGIANVPCSLVWISEGLAAGSHSFKLQWRIVGAGTATFPVANGIWFEIREL